ncbi:unnamed protein product, partial [Mesorhabditis belari]|uniref:NADP-dependent oxidoreductase domain-containing protein n=1 Tax=Mesorhabditis belari TaxID=2138241 RepID=A0AAF3ER15_9BILA
MTDHSFEHVEGGSVMLNTGHRMPMIGLGTYKIAGPDVVNALDAALRIGYRCFDTAIKYGNEAELGAAFEILLPIHRLKREDIFIASKIFPAEKNFVEECEKGVEESLVKLRTSYIDLYLVHYPTYDVFSEEADKDPINKERRRETYLTLKRIAAQGKIRSVGVSNFEPHHLEELDDLNDPPAVNQVEFHPHFTRKNIIKACKDRGIVFTAFGSLGRMEPSLFQDEALERLTEEMGCNRAQVLISYALSQEIPVCPKSIHEERLKQNFAAYKFRLSDEKVEALNARNKPGTQGNYIRAYGWRVV